MMGTAMMSWFWIWPTLVVVGLALIGFLAFRLMRNPGGAASGTGSARRILDERLARGEIDEDDYKRRADLL